MIRLSLKAEFLHKTVRYDSAVITKIAFLKDALGEKFIRRCQKFHAIDS